MLFVFGAIAAALVKFAFFADPEVAAVGPEAVVSEPVVTVETGTVESTLELSGNIARDAAYPLRAELNGTVTAVHVTEGQSVTAGQVLFTVKQDYPVRTVDVPAPEAGDISELAVVTGQAVSTGLEYTGLSPARYHIVSTVEPVQLYRLVGAPTEAEVTISGGPAPFTCTGVGVEVAEDGTSTVQCAVPSDQVVFSGLPVTMNLTLGTATDALVIPTTAVAGGSGTGKVWLTGGDEPEEREITLGVSNGEMVEVTDGLAAGDEILEYVPGVAAPDEQVCDEDGYCEEAGWSW